MYLTINVNVHVCMVTFLELSLYNYVHTICNCMLFVDSTNFCSFMISRCLFVIQEQCAVNAMAEMGLTPLHGAVMKDQSRMVELLLGHGADPTITDNDGDTPLHMALNNEDLHHPSDRTPELNKVGTAIII